MSGRGIFTGRCYICGIVCGRTYCQEHRELASLLSMPDRRDTIRTPTLSEVEQMINQLTRQERIIEGWRRVHGNGREKADV